MELLNVIPVAGARPFSQSRRLQPSVGSSSSDHVQGSFLPSDDDV